MSKRNDTIEIYAINTFCERFNASVIERPNPPEAIIKYRDNANKTWLEVTTLWEDCGHWESLLLEQLKNKGSITPKEAANLWSITTRAARERLKKMVEEGIIHRIASSDKDPKAIFILSKGT